MHFRLTASSPRPAGQRISARVISTRALRTKHADVGIVGTGFAGLSAALASREAGASTVLLLEKQSTPGGNSVLNAGQVAVAGSEKQKEKEVYDSVDLMVEDMRKAGRLGQPLLVWLGWP